MKATLSEKGQITIPKSVRDALSVREVAVRTAVDSSILLDVVVEHGMAALQ